VKPIFSKPPSQLEERSPMQAGIRKWVSVPANNSTKVDCLY
ncbi:unnamed protein product, partial [marine sediment metagenome]